MDAQVLAAQQWVNATYTGVAGYAPVPENGLVGWPTMFALTRALQSELGITALSDNFGSATLAALKSQFPVVDSAHTRANITGIVQAALWCKGYYAGPHFTAWGAATTDSLASINERLGLGSSTQIIPKVFKSLLTMDAYVVVGGGRSDIREVQQWLNGRYLARADYFIIPTDGIFSRDVQRGLLYAIQYELGMADGVANGNFGPGTQSGLKTYGVFGINTTDGTRKLVRLFQAALRFNGYSSTPFTGTFDGTTQSNAANFQGFAELFNSGTANFQTWASLLVSTGDPDRFVLGSDASTPLTPGKAAALRDAGYRTIGRYLSVSSKRYQPGEFSTIFNAGLTTIPIFQEWNNSSVWFDGPQGEAQGYAAVRRARQYGIRDGAIIYFPVDYDPTGDEITARIIPYFQGVAAGVARSHGTTFKVGVYGTRNVCARVSAAGLAVSSFVAGMSTGWSGNLGFPLPSNWHYDQIQGKTIGSGANAIEIDRVVRRTGAPSLDIANVPRTPLVTVNGAKAWDEDSWWRWAMLQFAADEAAAPEIGSYNQFGINDVILNRVQKPEFWANGPNTTPDPSDDDGLVRYFWATVYTPGYEYRLPAEWRLPWARLRERFEASVGNAENPMPNDAQLGDVDHFAASTRAYLKWPAPALGSEAQVSDLGSWATDLIRVWKQYEKYRIGVTTGPPQPIRSYFGENVGGSNASELNKSDLIADMAAFYVQQQIHQWQDRPLSEILRGLFVSIEDDPGYLAKYFANNRFGSREALVTIAMSVFSTSNWNLLPVQFGINYWLGGARRPGTTKDGNDPSPAEIAAELRQIGEGFADAIIAAQSWTS